MNPTPSIPKEYEGREQTYLKHLVLRQYLSSWVQKLARTGRPGEKTRLWYVDCFAGPWMANDQELKDTSIAIGLSILEDVLDSPNLNVETSAIFIEKKPQRYRQLDAFLRERKSRVNTNAFHGEFGDNVEKINSLVMEDPAFIFVDPTGWKGVDMGFVTPLLGYPRRDVLVNVMFNDVNRFKGDRREFLRSQMREFFGLDDSATLQGKNEKELMELYRTKLKEHSSSKHSLYIAIPHPTNERTWFYLVMAGSHPALVELYRSVEAKVVGEVAGGVRRDAKKRASDSPDQGEFDFGDPQSDHRYSTVNRAAMDLVPQEVEAILQERTKIQFRDLWPHLLERHPITLADLRKLIMKMRKDGHLRIEGIGERERTPKDNHWLHVQ
jgi:three-Cys-motif partner protein